MQQQIWKWKELDRRWGLSDLVENEKGPRETRGPSLRMEIRILEMDRGGEATDARRQYFARFGAKATGTDV